MLTGASGFLGSEICKQALTAGFEVTALVRAHSNLERIEEIRNDPRISIITIPNQGVQSTQIPDSVFKVDAVIHTATSYGRNHSKYSDVSEIIESNLTFPMNVMRRTAQNGSKVFINTDSYFNKPGLKYSALLDYSTTKKFFAEWLYENKYLQNVVTLRLEHVYGPNDSHDKFVPKLIDSVAHKQVKRFPLTSGIQLRDFIHVNDVATSFILAVSKFFPISREEFNGRYWEYEIGTSQAVSIRDFAERVKKLSNSNSILGFGDLESRPDEITRSVASNRFSQELGFVPKISLDQGILSLLR